ncbi:hypothetical protein [Paraburkholderia sp. CNPSo 3076]|uniref:hypothetical protein n=1 Tax=Paraburkholderia sp. CNPSo 3076 TaxID=2940936 RepID=UPI00225AC90A|nr:hypothetical protein [Paraburkholderia sp. CNPSo 3076]
MLMVQRKPGELRVQLFERVAGLVAALRTVFPERPVLVGIDGVDQHVTSSTGDAIELHGLANLCAGIVCAVDGRYGDERLLRFNLRLLGVTVLREPLFPESRAGGTAAHWTSYFPTAAKSRARVRRPASHVFDFLYVDQGKEFSGKTHSLIRRFVVEVWYAPAFRPDLRSVIERHFGTVPGFWNSLDANAGVQGSAGCVRRRSPKSR